MKKPQLKITIPEPCDQNWERMPVLPNGRHCDKCERNLFDFTGMSDEEVVKLIERTNGKVCGRFRKTQLDKPLFHEPDLHSGALVPAIMYTVLAAALTLPVAVNAQQTHVSKTEQTPASSPEQVSEKEPASELVVRARLLDADSGEPIAERLISVSEAGGRAETVTDKNGYFILEITDDLLVNDSLELHVQDDYLYSFVTFKIAKADLPKNTEIKIQSNREEFFLGMPMIIRPEESDED